ncbi:MAG: tetratricopeptide repeat protein [Chloroflexia bacterium]|nr:tetratricopeptide repeat protein [Chloroflexia bacterium]
MRRRLEGAGGAQVAFAVLALLVVCSLVAGSLGTLFLDGFRRSDADVESELSDPAGELADRLEMLLADNPDDAEARLLLANTLANTGRLREAVPHYEEVLKQDPDNLVARLDFAESLASGGNHADAELQFQRVLSAEPENVEAHYYFAELYSSWQPPRTELAIEEYQEVVRLEPESFFAELSQEALVMLGVEVPISSPAVTSEGGNLRERR